MLAEHRKEIENAVLALGRENGVVSIPTDTTYGVICRLDRPRAVEKIYLLKGRDRSKPLIILGSDPDKLLGWAAGNLNVARLLAARFWPGPLTIVVPAAEAVPPEIMAGGSTVGLRMPAHEAALSLLSSLPLCSAASTSANLSGAGSPDDIKQVIDSIGDKVDFVLADCGRKPAGNESTIVDVSGGRVNILRAGAIDPEEIFALVNGSRK